MERTLADGKVDGFLFHDESTMPYRRLTNGELQGAWHTPGNPDVREAIVAVPPMIRTPFEVAAQVHQQLLALVVGRGEMSKTLASSCLRPRLMSGYEVFKSLVLETPFLTSGNSPDPGDLFDAPAYWVIETLSPKRQRRRGFFLTDAVNGDTTVFFSDLDTKLIAFRNGALEMYEEDKA
jgi:hypothetical protein